MSEGYYVLEKMEETKRELFCLINTMPTKRKAIDIYLKRGSKERAKETFAELKTLDIKLCDTIKTLRLLFSEAEMKAEAEFANKVFAAIKKFNLLTPDYSKLIQVLEKLNDSVPDNNTVSAKVIGHLMNNVKMGYYPTEPGHIKMIKNSLKFPETSINILDPCCGCGLALNILTRNENAVTYGVEIDEARARDAETRLNRVGFGSYFFSNIGRESFHSIFLNPPYLNMMGQGGSKSRSEKRFLVESIHNLMMDGVLIYIIPYYRLTFDIAKILCDNFKEISVYRFLDNEFAKYKQIAVIGIKKEKSDGSEQAETLSEYAMLPEKIPYITELEMHKYTIPDVEKEVSLFQGAQFNLGELARQLEKSESAKFLFEKSRIDSNEKRPLLPLNIGQIGLVGGSGLINGYIDCDEPHIIKGRVIKEVKKRVDEVNDTLTETRVNKMLFNILTSDGVKRLA